MLLAYGVSKGNPIVALFSLKNFLGEQDEPSFRRGKFAPVMTFRLEDQCGLLDCCHRNKTILISGLALSHNGNEQPGGNPALRRTPSRQPLKLHAVELRGQMSDAVPLRTLNLHQQTISVLKTAITRCGTFFAAGAKQPKYGSRMARF